MIEFRIYAMMRSGQHAIMNWIYKQIKDSIILANSITGIIWQEEAKNYIDFLIKHGKPKYDSMNYTNIPVIGKNIMNGKFNYLIYNIEDEERPLLNFKEKNLHQRLGIGTGKIINILILRDVFNLFASRLKMPFKPKRMENNEKVAENWLIHAKEFITSNLLTNTIKINYNKWFTNLEYRKNLSLSLNLNFTDEGLKEVPNYGNGSSFDCLSYNNKAQEMKVNKRFEEFLNKKEYLRLFNKEVLETNKEIFGFNYLKIML